MLQQIKGAWPTFSEKSLDLYGGFIKEKARLYGRNAIEKTIRDAINAEPELPSVAELRAFLPLDAVKFRATTHGDCPDCGGSGWAQVFEGTTAGGKPIDPKVGASRRCHCWRKETA